jgi:hypothetical protein
MRTSKTARTILIIAGLVLLGVGAATLFVPDSFHRASGIDLGGDISLRNEIRAAGGALLAVGVFVLLGAFVASLARTAALVAALVYLSYGAGRLLSFAMDGRPAGNLVLAAAVELLIGLACVHTLVRYRHHGPAIPG